jgi:hypothetical protein
MSKASPQIEDWLFDSVCRDDFLLLELEVCVMD